MRPRTLIPLVSFIILAAFLSAPVQALLVARSISELTKAADAIVTGTVVDIESQWDVKHKTILTYVTVQIDRVIKNSTPKEIKQITLRLLGGTVGDMAADVPDMPKFGLDERVFLFLSTDTGVSTPSSKGDRLGDFTVRGWEMGKFTISDDLVEIVDRKNEIRGRMVLEDFVKDIETILSGNEQAPSFMDPKNLR